MALPSGFRPGLCAGLALLAAACGDEGRFGPPESYVLLAPMAGSTPPVLRSLREDEVQPVVKLFFEGFAAEMLRTVYMAKQLVREGRPAGRPFPGAAGGPASEGIPVVIGLERESYGRGLALHRTLRAPLSRPDVVWLGLRAQPESDPALVQTVAGRLASYVLELVLSGGTFGDSSAVLPRSLADGYRMAMEVIAREWRVGRGPTGVVAPDAGTPGQRAVFADVRENRFVLTDDGRAVRPAAELLASAGVAATVIYRFAQSKEVGQRVARDEFYAPFASRVPPGVSAAAVLGRFRNFQAKLLVPWSAAAMAGHPPRDVVDLLDGYLAAFPEEKKEALRIFIVTTFGGTVVPGGVPIGPRDTVKTLAAVDALVADVLAGRRSLRGAAVPAQ
jgi:hypothetical protein